MPDQPEQARPVDDLVERLRDKSRFGIALGEKMRALLDEAADELTRLRKLEEEKGGPLDAERAATQGPYPALPETLRLLSERATAGDWASDDFSIFVSGSKHKEAIAHTYDGEYIENPKATEDGSLAAAAVNWVRSLAASDPSKAVVPSTAQVFDAAPGIDQDLSARTSLRGQHGAEGQSEAERLLTWRNRQIKTMQAAWVRAAESALAGDLGPIRNRVDMHYAGPVEIVTSAALAKGEAVAASPPDQSHVGPQPLPSSLPGREEVATWARAFVEEQAAGEWGDELVQADADKLTEATLKLIEAHHG